MSTSNSPPDELPCPVQQRLAKRHQPTTEALRRLLTELPDEAAREAVLEEVLLLRCRKCLRPGRDAAAAMWCCVDWGED